MEEFIRLAGYNQTYAAVLLSHPPRQRRRQQRRQRQSVYRKVLPDLRNLWAISDAAGGKRLAPMIPSLVDTLKRHGEIKLSGREKQLLFSISPATVDRLLTPARSRIQLKGRSATKPGSRLKHQIPIRIFTDWDDRRLETPEQLKLLNQMYDFLSLYRNFFQTTMKLKQKQRVGGQVRRIYEKPSKTPYQRGLECKQLSAKQKQHLKKKYQSLNPAELLRQI